MTSSQALTLGARIIAGLSRARVDQEVGQYHIQKPDVTNQRCRIFTQHPMGIAVVGQKGCKSSSFAISVGVHIESIWDPLMDFVICDRIYVDKEELVKRSQVISDFIDIVIFDDVLDGYTIDLLDKLKSMVGHEPELLVCCGGGANKLGLINKKCKNFRFCLNLNEALHSVFDWRMEQFRKNCFPHYR